MGETILVALITGAFSVLGVILTNEASNKKIEMQLLTSQAVTDAKIENLTTEVRKHNSFGDRITRLEESLRQTQERLDRIDAKIIRLQSNEN